MTIRNHDQPKCKQLLNCSEINRRVVTNFETKIFQICLEMSEIYHFEVDPSKVYDANLQ